MEGKMIEKYGIGVDIEDINRFENLDYKKNHNFYHKIFTENEIEYCLSKKNPYRHFAVRFCAKEAFIKAINKKNIDMKEIEIIFNRETPFIKWQDNISLLSLSHEKDKAIAFVMVELL
jgi:holo-[acyl-carrier protein] synthase